MASAAAVDLSTYRSSKEATPLTEEEEAQLAALAEAHPEDAPKTHATAAFLVYITPQGDVVCTDPSEAVSTDRTPTLSDIYGACANVMMSIQGSTAAQQAQQLQFATARAIAQQQQSQQLLAQLPKDLGKRG